RASLTQIQFIGLVVAPIASAAFSIASRSTFLIASTRSGVGSMPSCLSAAAGSVLNSRAKFGSNIALFTTISNVAIFELPKRLVDTNGGQDMFAMTPIPITERMSDGTASGVNIVKTKIVEPAFDSQALSREIIHRASA